MNIQFALMGLVTLAPPVVTFAAASLTRSSWNPSFLGLLTLPVGSIAGYFFDVLTVQLYHATEWRNWMLGYKE
jgi:hypothetical protein